MISHPKQNTYEHDSSTMGRGGGYPTVVVVFKLNSINSFKFFFVETM